MGPIHARVIPHDLSSMIPQRSSEMHGYGTRWAQSITEIKIFKNSLQKFFLVSNR